MVERKNVSWGEALDESGRRFWETGIGHTLADALDYVKLPGQVAKGEVSAWDPETGHVSDDVIAKSAGGTLAMGLGSGAVQAAKPSLAPGEDAFGVFIGRKGGERLGKGLELQVAQGLHKQGSPIEDIRRQTGWGHGPRGPEDWQYEISDHAMKFKPGAWETDAYGSQRGSRASGGRPTLADTMDHPEWFKAYPETAGLHVDFEHGPYTRPGGLFDSENGLIRATGMDEKEVREILGHELQHTGDALERKSGGSSPQWTRGVIETQVLKELPPEDQAIYHALSEKEKNDIAYRRYRHDAGEVNAEITKNRLDLTPEQRLERAPRMDLPKDIDPNLITLGRASASYGSSVKPEMAIKGYHGSPHDFDRFSMDKIGTGEGAQAYGHGLYFAENEGVARSYRDALAPGKAYSLDGTSFKDHKDFTADLMSKLPADKAQSFQYRDGAQTAVHELLNKGTDPNSFIRSWERSGGNPEAIQGFKDALPHLDKIAAKPKGRMYEVEIDAQPEQFLDFDAPLSAQPEAVRRVLGDTGDPRHLRPKDRDLAHIVDRALKDAERPDEVGLIIDNDSDLYKKAWDYARRTLPPHQLKTAEALDQSVGGFVADQAKDYLGALSKRNVSGDELLKLYRGKEPELAKAGVPGVKYRDANSRGTNEGSRNYVTFSDDIVKILRKYGVAGLAMLPPAVQATLLDGGQEKP